MKARKEPLSSAVLSSACSVQETHGLHCFVRHNMNYFGWNQGEAGRSIMATQSRHALALCYQRCMHPTYYDEHIQWMHRSCIEPYFEEVVLRELQRDGQRPQDLWQPVKSIQRKNRESLKMKLLISVCLTCVTNRLWQHCGISSHFSADKSATSFTQAS